MNDIRVKLPKLVITKFEGTNLDWLGFWNQFQTESDKVEISATSKFFYLKECLTPKVRAQTNSFPFTPERYASPNSSLLAKFGRPSELPTAHMQCMSFLPFLTNLYPNKINKFYEIFFSLCRFLIKWISWEILKCARGLLWINYQKLWMTLSDCMMSDKSGTFSSQLNHYVTALIVIWKREIILRNIRKTSVTIYFN